MLHSLVPLLEQTAQSRVVHVVEEQTAQSRVWDVAAKGHSLVPKGPRVGSLESGFKGWSCTQGRSCTHAWVLNPGPVLRPEHRLLAQPLLLQAGPPRHPGTGTPPQRAPSRGTASLPMDRRPQGPPPPRLCCTAPPLCIMESGRRKVSLRGAAAQGQPPCDPGQPSPVSTHSPTPRHPSTAPLPPPKTPDLISCFMADNFASQSATIPPKPEVRREGRDYVVVVLTAFDVVAWIIYMGGLVSALQS